LITTHIYFTNNNNKIVNIVTTPYIINNDELKQHVVELFIYLHAVVSMENKHTSVTKMDTTLGH